MAGRAGRPVIGESLVISEKGGAMGTVALRGGAVARDPVALALPATALAPRRRLVS